MTCHGQHRVTIIHHPSRTAQSYHHPSPVQDSTELPSSLTRPGQHRVTIIPYLSRTEQSYHHPSPVQDSTEVPSSLTCPVSRTTQVDVSLIRDSVSITLRNTAKCDELHTATQECQTMLHSICDSNIRNDIRLSAYSSCIKPFSLLSRQNDLVILVQMHQKSMKTLHQKLNPSIYS